MCRTEKELDEEYKNIVSLPSSFWQDVPTESLRKALEWRKKELQRHNQPARQAEAKRAVKALSKELVARANNACKTSSDLRLIYPNTRLKGAQLSQKLGNS